MVYELVLSGMVSQAVPRYGPKIFALIDDNVGALLRRGAAGDTQAAREADQLLISEIERSSDGGARLVEDLMELPDADADDAPTPRLKKFGEILNGVFNMVSELEPAVAALPGWFHSSDCVIVVDARQIKRGAWIAPQPSWRGNQLTDAGDPHYQFFGTSGSIEQGMPRVWVIDCDGDDRDSVVDRLRRQLTTTVVPAVEILYLKVAELAEVEESRVWRSAALYGDRVLLRRPRDKPAMQALPGETLAATIIRRSGLPRDWTERAIGRIDGVKLLKKSLAEIVNKQVEREIEWLTL